MDCFLLFRKICWLLWITKGKSGDRNDYHTSPPLGFRLRERFCVCSVQHMMFDMILPGENDMLMKNNNASDTKAHRNDDEVSENKNTQNAAYQWVFGCILPWKSFASTAIAEKIIQAKCIQILYRSNVTGKTWAVEKAHLNSKRLYFTRHHFDDIWKEREEGRRKIFWTAPFTAILEMPLKVSNFKHFPQYHNCHYQPNYGEVVSCTLLCLQNVQYYVQQTLTVGTHIFRESAWVTPSRHQHHPIRGGIIIIINARHKQFSFSVIEEWSGGTEREKRKWQYFLYSAPLFHDVSHFDSEMMLIAFRSSRVCLVSPLHWELQRRGMTKT